MRPSFNAIQRFQLFYIAFSGSNAPTSLPGVLVHQLHKRSTTILACLQQINVFLMNLAVTRLLYQNRGARLGITTNIHLYLYTPSAANQVSLCDPRNLFVLATIYEDIRSDDFLVIN